MATTTNTETTENDEFIKSMTTAGVKPLKK